MPSVLSPGVLQKNVWSQCSEPRFSGSATLDVSEEVNPPEALIHEYQEAVDCVKGGFEAITGTTHARFSFPPPAKEEQNPLTGFARVTFPTPNALEYTRTFIQGENDRWWNHLCPWPLRGLFRRPETLNQFTRRVLRSTKKQLEAMFKYH